MLPLPLSLLLLSQWVLFLNGAEAEQCRLKANNALGNDPSIPSGVPLPSPNATTTSNFPTPSSSNSNTTSVNSTSGTLPTFNYGTDIIRGVNLGGWFVLEPWITPSIFENTNNDAIIDEFTFGQMQDSQVALNALTNHWETWIVEDDFAAMKAAGLNHVRIPVGYWSVPLTSSDTKFNTSVAPYVSGAWPYLLKALTWAKSNSIHVILDLHGAPGSQNGYDNSGQRTGNPQWATDPDNIAHTLDILRYIATNIGGMIDVIELLNEPGGFMPAVAQVIRQFWLDGYGTARAAAGGGIKIMIGDAFMGVQSWTNFLTYPQGQGVLMDYHEYQIFSKPELARSFDQHIAFACSLNSTLTSFATGNLWTINGEWSNAPTDCAKWLNGRGIGARWDGSWQPDPTDTQVFGSCDGWTGDSANFSTSYKTFLRQYWEVQVDLGESIQGWVFWTWKAENADEWSYQKGLQGGWIPQDPTNRMYPGMCS